MKRWKHGLPTVAATLVALAACTGGDVGTPGGTGGATATGTGGATGAQGSGTIDVVAVWTGKEQASFEAVLEAFTAKTGVKTRYKSTGDDVAAFLGTQIEGGSPPDVAILPQPGLLRDLADRNVLKPVGEAGAKALEENYAPVWRDLASVDGTLYGVYFKAANKSTWWYDPAAFEEAGVTPPKTWEEMLGSAETVSRSGRAFVSIGGADGWTLTDWFENIYLRTAGPEMYDKLANHEIPWTDPSVIQALDTFARLLSKDSYVAGGRRGALQTDFPTSVTQVFGKRAQAATVYEADFVAGIITEEAERKPGEGFDFFDFPAVGESGPAVVGGGDVAVALTDDASAQQLLSFLATSDAAKEWAERGGFTSPNKNLDPGVYPDDITRRSAESVSAAAESGAFRFDMSDLQPAAFGGTPGRGLFLRLQDFLKNPGNARGIATALERDAARAFKNKKS